VFLLSLITAIVALIPFVGAAAVWIPVSLYLFFYEERTVAAIALAIYGAVIVSTSDNLVKATVLHGQSQLHPLLALLSVLGGVAALGPIGIIVGPMVVVFLQTLLNLLHRELAEMDEPAAPASPAITTVSGEAVVASPPVIDADTRETPPPTGKRRRRRSKR
jgi:predicted PurR-regulated permease PerM